MPFFNLKVIKIKNKQNINTSYTTGYYVIHLRFFRLTHFQIGTIMFIFKCLVHTSKQIGNKSMGLVLIS